MLTSHGKARLQARVAAFEANGANSGLWLHAKLNSGRDNEVTVSARALAAAYVRAKVDDEYGEDHTPVVTYDWNEAFERLHAGVPKEHVFYVTKYHAVIDMSVLPDQEPYLIPIRSLFDGLWRGTQTERAFQLYRRAKQALWRDGLIRDRTRENRAFI